MPRKSNSPLKHKSAPPAIISAPPAIQIARPSFGQTLKEGIAFGAGQSIAHRAIGILLGGSASAEHVKVSEKPEYVQCMRESNSNEEACKQFL
jgi:hypothetical protein